ncbi:DUF5047 domain-containing protein [Kribbella solani]|uniref:DUF5047 domain-containing protein n=1 Tax=Kribbella solani TaxID=236067 RepID=UPI0029BC41E2|nr:DUF5047 domain-containing protein [Kribbella solani]MDX3006743.1 DUF5047 domain-containing protein [Kribbella solani]
MRPVSDKFLETLRGSHLAVFRARVQSGFLIGTNPGGTELPILAGDVQFSATADIRSTLNLTTSWPWPASATDTLAPYGSYIYVERGLAYGNAQREWVGLGYYRIDTIEQDTAPDGEIVISGSDRNAGLRDARFEAPQQFPLTWTNGDVVNALIWGVYNFAGIIEWDSPAVRDDTINRTIITENDRLPVLLDLLTSLGKIGYWDQRGIFVIKTPPDVTGAPTWTVDAGANGVLVQMRRGLTREGVYNAVVATGEAGDTKAPARGVAYDLNPNSPTYYNGGFGKVPRFYSSPFITTNAQARTAANALLRQQLGLPYQVDLSSIANPALEPYDVLQVAYPKTSRNRALLTETHVIDQITIPLTPKAPVSLKTREQQKALS